MSEIYWAIKDEKGKLIKYTDSHRPILCLTRKEAEKEIERVCAWWGSKPVRVTITEVE